MSKPTFNERKSGFTKYTQPAFSNMKLDVWHKVVVKEVADPETGAISKIKETVTIDRSTDEGTKTLDQYEAWGRQIQTITSIDTGTRQTFVWVEKVNIHQTFRRTEDAVGVIARELSLTHGDDAAPVWFIERILNRVELFSYCSSDGFWPFGAPIYSVPNRGNVRNSYIGDSIAVDLTTPLTDREKTILEDFVGGIIRTNLCNLRGKRTFDDLMHIIHDRGNEAERDFRYVMHNIATNYMRPGTNIPTNLAICDTLHGMGKGYLADIVGLMIGMDLVAIPKNPLSDFNNWQHKRTLAILNEVQGQHMNDRFNTFIKSSTIDTYVPLEAKYGDQKIVPNMTNYWLFSNSLHPYKTDSTDRRTIFIRAFHSSSVAYTAARKAYPIELGLKYEDDHEVARALAKMCHMIDLDKDVLRYYRTALAEDILEASGTGFESFMMNEDLSGTYAVEIKPSGTNVYRVRARDLMNAYNNWADSLGRARMSQAEIKAAMQKATTWFRENEKARQFFINVDNLIAARKGIPLNSCFASHTGTLTLPGHLVTPEIAPDEDDGFTARRIAMENGEHDADSETAIVVAESSKNDAGEVQAITGHDHVAVLTDDSQPPTVTAPRVKTALERQKEFQARVASNKQARNAAVETGKQPGSADMKSHDPDHAKILINSVRRKHGYNDVGDGNGEMP